MPGLLQKGILFIFQHSLPGISDKKFATSSLFLYICIVDKNDPPISLKFNLQFFFTHASSLQAHPILMILGTNREKFCSFFNSNDHEREIKPQMISFLGTQQVTKGINGRPWESALASRVFLSLLNTTGPLFNALCLCIYMYNHTFIRSLLLVHAS